MGYVNLVFRLPQCIIMYHHVSCIKHPQVATGACPSNELINGVLYTWVCHIAITDLPIEPLICSGWPKSPQQNQSKQEVNGHILSPSLILNRILKTFSAVFKYSENIQPPG